MVNPKKAPWYFLLLLIVAGESVFILPFVLSRVFRPVVLEAFNLDNYQLGMCFSIYGIVALFSYLFGGPLADRFAPRKLLAIALWATAAGGFVYATFPDFRMLQVLYGYWGFTTIFLFWAPMIKATRIWGGSVSQGKAFGFLDGGRGLTGALFAAMGVLVFSLFLSPETANPGIHESKNAFRQIVLISSGTITAVGVLVWFFLKFDRQTEEAVIPGNITRSQISSVVKLPAVWLLMLIICCAYVGYKITDVFSLYARDVLHYDPVDSAQVGTFLLFIRPLVGVLIGLLVDYRKTSLWLMGSFVVTLIGALLFTSGWISASGSVLFLLSTLTTAMGVYASRCLYFAVMEQGNIPIALTGTAVGLISLVGYTPDIFAGPLIGSLLDQTPGAEGYRHVFGLLGGFALIGGIASWWYYRLAKASRTCLQDH